MKINLNTKIKDEKGKFFGENIPCLVLDADGQFKKKPDGKLVVIEKDNEDVKSTLRGIIKSSLLFESQQKPIPSDKKMRRWSLWNMVDSDKATIELKIDDLQLIKDCILDCQPVVIAGQCVDLLEK